MIVVELCDGFIKVLIVEVYAVYQGSKGFQTWTFVIAT